MVSIQYSPVGDMRACFQSMAEQDLSQSEKTLHIVYLTSCLEYSSIFTKYNRCLDDNEELFRNVDQCWAVEFLSASGPFQKYCQYCKTRSKLAMREPSCIHSKRTGGCECWLTTLNVQIGVIDKERFTTNIVVVTYSYSNRWEYWFLAW